MSHIERKHGPSASRADAPIRELKFIADNAGMAFSGYGAVFGNVDSTGDVIQPGAFADTLAQARKTGNWPVMLLQHGGLGMGADDLMPVGIWTELAEDGHGLKVEGKLADTARGREAYALLKMEPRPAITGLSIGYIAKEWAQRSKPEEPRRSLKKVDLLEVSLVTFPANDKARIAAVKSDFPIREFERFLQHDAEFRCSRAEARGVITRFKSWLGTHDAGEPQPDDVSLAAELRSLAATFRKD